MPQATTATIDDYINTFPSNIQSILQQVRQSIHHAVPEASETISYGIPTFDLNAKHLVSFAGWKRHIALYPLPAGDAAFQQALAPYRRGKGSIQFPFHTGVPYALVEDIVRLLVAEKLDAER